ncbi:prenyltransferase/squalene oxidase repeat-containing protein [Clostridium culturomicium]|uniref:prenyltransferase/squalene oxidase repeat-containing protein n=1 Tax=Clostridium culturomicium TaxID=1499683 RepID=UPI000B2B0045|nr:prenyltransferase/squalene oxidase repeat-containing protein [Clostridium culturomicium]
MKQLIRRIIVFTLAGLIILFSTQSFAYAEHEDYTLSNLEETMVDIINWKKSESGIKGQSLFSEKILTDAGKSSMDWFAVGLGRMGYTDDYISYLGMLKNTVRQKYLTVDKLDAQKATEWHRISLAILSLGGDPTNIENGTKENIIDLIADGTYNRGYTEALGSQGINGYIWGLITLDSLRYSVPENSSDTRDSIIEKILENQRSDGAFSLNGEDADIDITAMALTALSPYYNSEQSYSINGEEMIVRHCVDKAVNYLSVNQNSDGGYTSWGMGNCESTAQVIVALCSLGIDPVNDIRFIKDGNNVLDGLMQYKIADGGFTHSYKADEDNPFADPGKSNSMASEQALYSLVALYRFQTDLRSLFDFRPEMSNIAKTQIQNLEDSIDNLVEDSAVVEKLFKEYLLIPITERCYVKNYSKLADAMENLGIENTSEYLSANMNENISMNGTVIDIIGVDAITTNFIFNESDLETYKGLPKEMGTEYYAMVIRLLEKLKYSQNIDKYEDILTDLESKKIDIEEIQQEIENINATIVESLYPFENISYKDKDTIDSLISRIDGLNEYDRKKVLGYEDVIRANTQIKTQIRTIMITILIITVVIILSIVLVVRYKKKRRMKLEENLIDNDEW